jgi:hypothetical protein
MCFDQAKRNNKQQKKKSKAIKNNLIPTHELCNSVDVEKLSIYPELAFSVLKSLCNLLNVYLTLVL